jgi:hypothetical protein
MANTYAYRSKVRLSVAFTDSDGMAVDPANVYCQVKPLSSTTTTYTYGVDDELVRDSVGNYHLDIDCNAVGNWYYAWYATGDGQAADESYIIVDSSEFD